MKNDQNNTSSEAMGSETSPKSVTPADIVPPEGATAYTRALYRKLQEAMGSGDERQAFSLLLKILDEVPGDRTASRLAREVGQRLYLEYGATLQETLDEGNIVRLTQLVATLRLMASDAQLEALPAFREAADKVDAEERRRLNINLHAGICRMRETSDLKAREQLALSIEQFAAQKGLPLTPEQQALLADVHAAWKHFCQLEQWRRGLEEQRAIFREWEHKARNHGDLAQCSAQLAACSKAVQALRALPESSELLEKVERCRQGVDATLSAQRRRRALIRTALATTVILIALAIATVIFAFIKAGQMADELAAGRTARHVATVRALTEDFSPLRPLCLMLSPTYAEELGTAQQWLEGYREYKNRLDDLAPRLISAAGQLKGQNVTPEQMVDGLALQREVEQISHNLQESYNEAPNAELVKNMEVFPAQLHHIRDEVLSRFLHPTGCADMAALYALYQKYEKCCVPLDVRPEEQDRIQAGFMAAATELLTRPASQDTPFRSAQEAAAAVADFRKYASTMKLDDALYLQLQEESRQAAAYENLPETLQQAGNLNEYVAALQSCRNCYEKLEGVMPLDELQAVVGKEGEYMLQYKLAEYYQQAGERQGDSTRLTREQLEMTRQVYSGQKPLYAEGEPPAAMAKLLDPLFSSTEKSWPAGLHSLRKGKYFYLGRLTADQKKLTIAGGGNRGKSETVTPSSTLLEIDLAGAREAMGFQQAPLMAGTVTPARLMHNIATASSEKYPGKVRAYLFKVAVDMLDKLEPHLSGKVFSTSLQADVEQFNALRARKDIESLGLGSWFAYKYTDEEAWNSFFAEIAPHDYEKEIRDAVLPIVGATCELAGYIDSQGRPVRFQPGEEPLFLIEGSSIRPYTGTEPSPRPYTPLFKAGIAQ